MNENANLISTIEIVGFVITFVSATATLLFSQEEKGRNTVFVSLWGAILTMFIGIRFEFLPHIKDQTELVSTVQDSATVRGLVTDLSASISATQSSSDSFIQDAFEDRLGQFNRELEDFSSQKFSVSSSELDQYAMKLIGRSKESFEATSYLTPEDWWETKWGKDYHRANIRAAKNGLKIDRTWIYKDDDQLKRVLPFINEQADAGIKSRVLDLRTVNLPLTADLVLIDGDLAGELSLTPSSRFNRATFYARDVDVAEIERNLRRIQRYATDFDQIFFARQMK